MSEAEDASGKGSNLTAIEAISARLAEVTRLAEKLDAKLCEAGARTRPVPMSSSAMSSTSSLFSSSNLPITTSTPVPSQIQTISTSSIGITAPLISSSVSTVQLQPKCVSTILSSASNNNESVASKEKISSLVTSTSQSANGTVSTDVSTVNGKASSTAMESAKKEGKIVEEEDRREEESKNANLDRTDRTDDAKTKEEIAEDVIEKSFDDSLAEDSNIEDYVTATERSITPTVRSRSESFVTSPECEDLAVPATVTSANDTWWNIEEPKFITATSAAVTSSTVRQMEASKEPKAERKIVSMDTTKPEVSETNKEKQLEKLVSMEKKVEEKSGKIVKEVTETTTLRVSHDTRLGIASYKVISNTTQDHRENVDVKEIKDLERIVFPDVRTNGLHHETDSGCKSDSYSRRDELSTKTDDTEHVIKFAKICELNQESRTIPAEILKDSTLSLKEYTRHGESCGIETTPTRVDENLEGQDFLDRARKVSSVEGSSMNGDRKNGRCNCSCSHEAACFDRLSAQQNLIEFNSVNENRRCVSLSNAS
ncbi:hypothetical protein K0M31_010464 [Melipona bicolor]|uniref:Uncharacterized protein n=1 Tax=Melipona bicolor TaxID=60889 RepID=A0AA40FLR3_9HYME|nr:hypothetical protein K0M31_010464 [Melipona bicolor]